MSTIDSRILIVGLPTIAAALGANAVQAIWFTQAYTLGSTAVILTIGRISDIFGRVRIYIIGFTIFTVASLLVSLSTIPNEVILFRAIQGFGSGVLMVNSTAIITDATPKDKLGLSLGINQIASALGSVLGLTISGIIIYFAGWRALFYINIPIGIFGTLWAKQRLKELAKTDSGSPIDWLGFVSFSAAITSILLALTEAAYGADIIIIYVLLTAGIAVLAAFVVHELRTKYPMLDLNLLKVREFTGGTVAQLLNSIAFGAATLLLSFYLQLGQGLSPLEAGIRIIPMDVISIFFAVICGRLSDRFGPTPFATGALALESLAFFLLSGVTVSTPYSYLVIEILLIGIGLGLFVSPNMSSIMGSVPPQRRGVAAAFRSLMQNLGTVLSLNIAMLVMTFTMPLPLLSAVIGGTRNLSEADTLLFIQAIKNTYLWLAAINAIAILPSAFRGKRRKLLPTESPKASDLVGLE